MARLSIIIITLNEEKNLARCLDSVQGVADEIIVVDSYSTDNTAAIAAQYNAKVIQQSFIGYGEQKNFATQQAAHNWILSLDADEALTPELIQSIQEVKKAPQYNVYQMARLTNYCGQWIKHCGWYPDKQTRLYDRTKGKWQEQNVHEYWKPYADGDKAGMLTGDLLHYSFTSITQHLQKIEKYSELAAADAIAKHKNAGLLKIALYPKWRFFTEYIIRLGFLDCFYGYIICRLAGYATFIKYSKVRAYRNK